MTSYPSSSYSLFGHTLVFLFPINVITGFSSSVIFIVLSFLNVMPNILTSYVILYVPTFLLLTFPFIFTFFE